MGVLAHLPALRRLTLVGSNLADLNWLGSLPALCRLEIERCAHVVDLEPIAARAEQIEWLTLRDVGVAKAQFPEAIKRLLKRQ